MKFRIANPLSSYAVAVLLVGLAFAARWALTPVIGETAPFIVFLLAAILSAVIGGLGPGLLALAAGQFLAHYFFTVPRYTFYPTTSTMWVYWALCDVVTLLCLGVVDALHRESLRSEESIARARRHEEQLRTIIREITATQERARELASVVESADDAVISITLGGAVKNWNVGAERLFGFSAVEMMAKPLSRIIPEDRLEEHSALVSRVASGESTAPVETTRITKDGGVVEVSIRCSPLRTETGKVVGVSAIARDISSAKKAEAEIKRLNRDLNQHLHETREVMEVLPVGLAIASEPACRAVEINPVLSRMLGVAASGLELDNAAIPFTLQQDGVAVPAGNLPLRAAASENREIRDWGARITRGDGSSIDVLVHAAPLHDEEGRVRGAIGAFVDISDLKRAHAALLETEQRFRAMADTAPLMIWMSDADNQSTWVNKTWRTFTGRTSELEHLEGWAEPIHAEDLPAWRQTIDSVSTRKESFEVEYRLRRADGEWRWVLDRGVPRFGHDGRFLGCIGSCMDVTEWKKAEEALDNKFDELRQAQLTLRSQNEELARHRRDLETERGKYRELFDSAPIGYIITSRQGVIQQVNRAAAEMLAESSEFLDGFPFARLLAKQDRAAFFANIGKLTRGEVACIQGWEATVAPHSKPSFPCSIIVNLVQDEGGHVLGLRWILRDITDRREAEQRIMRLNAELEQRVRERTAALEAANRELEAFSYSVSHDLRAPLRSINGFSKAVLEEYSDKLDQQGSAYLRYVQEASVRMGHLIEDLLELSRVARGDLQCHRLDLSAMVKSVAADLRAHEPFRKVELIVQPGLWANGDSGLLRIALENLLGNSWKFTSGREQARIEVGFTRNNDRPCIFVRDNGAGFNMSGAGRLFGVFQRLHSQEEFPGTGIGLATVKRVLVRHGGDVWGESKVNEGATFYFTLPELGVMEALHAKTDAESQTATVSGPSSAQSLKRQRPEKLSRQERSAA